MRIYFQRKKGLESESIFKSKFIIKIIEWLNELPKHRQHNLLAMAVTCELSKESDAPKYHCICNMKIQIMSVLLCLVFVWGLQLKNNKMLVQIIRFASWMICVFRSCSFVDVIFCWHLHLHWHSYIKYLKISAFQP